MAKIPYLAIAEKIKERLKNDSRTTLVKVLVESSLIPTMDFSKHISIYLKNCSRETILMGRSNTSRECILEYELDCNTYHAGSLLQSFERRDDLIADTENIMQEPAILKDLQSLITDTQFLMLDVTETNFETPQENSQLGFMARAIITINITVRA